LFYKTIREPGAPVHEKQSLYPSRGKSGFDSQWEPLRILFPKKSNALYKARLPYDTVAISAGAFVSVPALS